MLSLFRGKKNHTTVMERVRKCGLGIGNKRDVCHKMTTEQRQYVRERARHTARESQHRLWLLLLPAYLLRKRVL